MKRALVLATVLAAGTAAQAQVVPVGTVGPLAGFNASFEHPFSVGAPGAITGVTISADMLAVGGGSFQSDMKLVRLEQASTKQAYSCPVRN